MPYSETLANRIGDILAGDKRIDASKMFGGIAFLVNGKMSVGVLDDDLVVRVSPDDGAKVLSNPHTRPMDFTGRPMKGFIYVSPDGTKTKAQLAKWVKMSVDYADSLPDKKVNKKTGRGRIVA